MGGAATMLLCLRSRSCQCLHNYMAVKTMMMVMVMTVYKIMLTNINDILFKLKLFYLKVILIHVIYVVFKVVVIYTVHVSV